MRTPVLYFPSKIPWHVKSKKASRNKMLHQWARYIEEVIEKIYGFMAEWTRQQKGKWWDVKNGSRHSNICMTNVIKVTERMVRFGSLKRRKMSQMWRKTHFQIKRAHWVLRTTNEKRCHPRQSLGEREFLYRKRLPIKQWKLDCHWISRWSNIFKAETGILYPAKSALCAGKEKTSSDM